MSCELQILESNKREVDLEKELALMREDCKDLLTTAEQRRVRNTEELEALRSTQMELKTALVQAEAQGAGLKTVIDTLSVGKEEMCERLMRLELKLTSTQDQKASLMCQVQGLQEEHEELQKNYDERCAEMAGLKMQIEIDERAMTQAMAELEGIFAKRCQEEMESSCSSMDPAVKASMQQLKQLLDRG
ncbi:hypothetical protein CYMTET_11933 [Cymbomonas tetramitiformis]|uniref:Uncharacterized protein n=1 Tax=Cymbomonas tetramitiformis TaxID=36881 RepID=A0AAE0GLM0_9CHLO|nr:hypothetical protein CYMTET_11933 [Cymbomonas tetramitiformis]